MKNKYLFLILLLVNIVTVKAQDLYWPTINSSGTGTLFNTSTGTSIAFPEDQSTYMYADYHDVILNGSGDLLFTGEQNPYAIPDPFNFSNLGTVGQIDVVPAQIFPIPGSCNKFYAMSNSFVTNGQNKLTLTLIDASAVLSNGHPTEGAPQTIGTGNSFWSGDYFGAVAARLNPDGTRYIYYLDGSQDLFRYTVSANGTVSTASDIASGMPYNHTDMHTSVDGATLAYFDINGSFFTYNVNTGVSTSYTGMMAPLDSPVGHPKGVYMTPGVAQVTVGTTHRWYVNNGTVFGYFTEGNASSWTPITLPDATTTSLALGKNGLLYYASGTPVNNAGSSQLSYYNPANGSTGTITNTYIFPLNFNDKSFYFGNHVEGEDITNPTKVLSATSFTVDGIIPPQSQLNTTPPPIVSYCPNSPSMPLVASVSGAYPTYTIQVTKGTWALVNNGFGVMGVFTPSTAPGSTLTTTSISVNASSLIQSTQNILSDLSALVGYSGYIQVTVTPTNACGQTGAPAQQLFNVVENVAVTAANFEINGSEGPNAYLCSGSTSLNATNATETGTMSSYSVTVQQGTYSGGNFTGNGTLPATTGNIAATSLPATIPVYNVNGNNYLSTYSGYVQVTLTVNGPCGSPVKAYRIINLQRGNPVTNLAFSLNGQTQATATSTPPTVALCPGDAMKMLMSNMGGPLTNYSISVQKGSWSGTTFTASGTGFTAPFIASTLPATSVDLTTLNSSFTSYLGGYAGELQITLRAIGLCDAVSAVTTEVFHIQQNMPVATVNFNVNGKPNTSIPTISLCDGNTVLNMTSVSERSTNPAIPGAMSSYTVTLQQGSMSGSTFTPNGTIPATKTFTATSLTPAITIYNIDGNNYLLGYSGDVQVTLTVNGPCGSPVTQTEIINLQQGTSISGLTYKINNETGTTTPGEIWQCNGNNSLLLAATATAGTVTDYTIKVEEGTYSGGTFSEPVGGSSVITADIPATSLPNVDLFSNSTLATYLTGYNGYIRVTLTVNGQCNSANSVQIFDVQSATGSVDFSMVGPSSCTAFQSRNPTPTFATFTQPVSTPPCVLGWLGSISCGLTGATASATGGYSEYTVEIDQYDATGTTLQQQLVNTTTAGTVPASLNFNTLTSAYFISNYATIKDNNAFKVTITINSAYCGPISNSSWFKIIDGGPAGYFKSTGVPSLQPENDEFSFYPNPATSIINFSWISTSRNDATLEIYDIVGKLMYRSAVNEQSGSNEQTVDVSNLTPGMYVYKLSCAQGLKTGKFQKL